MKLIFVEGNCVKRISGDAVPDVPGATVVDEAPGIVGVSLRLIKLVDGAPVAVPPPTEEIAAQEAKADLDAFLRKAFLAAFNHENRLRVLEGKPPVTREQFKAAL